MQLIVWESSLIRINCDDWGRWSLYYKHRNVEKELIDVAQVGRIIRLEEEFVGLVGYSFTNSIDDL